jgi:3,4-dihydroxy 2-butanone 4-phosphate synthase
MSSAFALSPIHRPTGIRAWAHNALAAGLPAVLLDEEGAVLVFPAATATASQLHFAIRYSSGLIHAAMPTSRLDQLRVPDQPVLASEDSGTSFTVSVDATTGIGTGISAHDRAHTTRVLADHDAVPDDLTRPGHVLPIRCADSGFAERARVWELAVDLVSGAGHPPVAVVCRLIDDESGEPLDEVSATVFALCHGLPLCGWPV